MMEGDFSSLPSEQTLRVEWPPSISMGTLQLSRYAGVMIEAEHSARMSSKLMEPQENISLSHNG